MSHPGDVGPAAGPDTLDTEGIEVGVDNPNPFPMCNGICVMGYEILPEGGNDVAYPHPECELHR